MDFGVNDSGDQGAAFKIDCLQCLRRRISFADRDDFFLIDGHKALDNFPRSYNLSIRKKYFHLSHGCLLVSMSIDAAAW